MHRFLVLASADANGGAKPDNATASEFAALICSDPRTAAKQYMTMIDAGGTQAQVLQHHTFALERRTGGRRLPAVWHLHPGQASVAKLVQQGSQASV